MTRIIQFPLKSEGKFGLKPARKKKPLQLGDADQLNLFQSPQEAKVISLKSENQFERAIQLHDNNPEQALLLYQQSIDNEEHVADSHCNRGILFASKDEIPQAIDSFTKALHEEPRHFEGHFNLANIYADEGNHSLSELHYRIATEIEPRDPNIFYNLALVCALQEKYEDALNALNSYFKLQSLKVVDKEAQQLLAILQSSFDVKKGS